jgi:apolipoprotein N-acyltransferase
VGFVPVLVALRGTGPKRAYWLGFTTLVVHFSITTYWVVVAMTVFGRVPLSISLIVLFILTSAMAAYVGASFAIARMLAGRFGVPQWLGFPAAITAAELLRNYGPLGGFPWGNVGFSLVTIPLLRQGAALVGVYGLVFVVALVNAVVAEAIAARLEGKAPPKRALAVAGAVVVVFVSWGAHRLANPPTATRTVVVGLLQGNIEQGIKNQSEQNADGILRKFHDLQDRAIEAGAELLVWPEAAFPMRVPLDRKSFEGLGLVPKGAPPPPATIVGVSGVARVKDEDTGKTVRRNSNSAFYLDGFDVVGRVDKTHLVPFGEYVPWPLQSIIRELVPIGAALPGKEFAPVAMRIGDDVVKVGVTICYEGMFPEISRAFFHAGAELMVNLTNDAWYGVSSMAKQHMLMYSLRAVESGIPVARAANTGISAWFDTRGTVHDETPIYADAALVAAVPLARETTPYAVLGEWVALPCLLFVMGGWVLAMVGADALRRKRHVVESAIGVAGLIVAVGAIVAYFVLPSWTGDEARATHAQLAAIGGLLVGVGALSARPWGRKAQLWVGALVALFAPLGIWMSGPVAVLFLLGGVALFVQAKRRRDRYDRAPDPLVLDGR